MKRNKYDLHIEVLGHKYGEVLQGFEEARDDRRIAWNLYQQIVGACKAMVECNVTDTFICVAVNKKIAEEEAMIDSIITRFTGKTYVSCKWMADMDKRCDVFRMSCSDEKEDALVKTYFNFHDAGRFAKELQDFTGITHYVLVHQDGEPVRILV